MSIVSLNRSGAVIAAQGPLSGGWVAPLGSVEGRMQAQGSIHVAGVPFLLGGRPTDNHRSNSQWACNSNNHSH
jgi:hypothetical protein